MLKAIPWVIVALAGAHLLSLSAFFLLLGRVEIDDVSW